MSSQSDISPTARFTDEIAPSNPRVTAHFVVGVAWLFYWLSNVYVLFADLLPFLNYYVMVALFLMYYAVMRPMQVVQFMTTPLLWVWASTAVIPGILYLTGSGETVFAESIAKAHIVYFSALASMGLVLADTDGARALQTAARITLALTIVMCFGELFIHNPYATAPGRSAGFYTDANAAAAALAVTLLLSVDITKQSLLGLSVVGLTVIAIVTTLSRAGIILGALLASAYLFLPRGRGTLAAGSRLAIALAAVASGVLIVTAAVQLFEIDTREAWRIQSALTLDTSDSSAQGRIDRVFFTFEKFLEHFWTGRGPGSTFYYGIAAHNTYLTIGYEYGIFGVLLYCGFIAHGFAITWWYGWRRASVFSILAVTMAFLSIFSHTVHYRATLSIVFAVFMTRILLKPLRDPGAPADAEARPFGAEPASPFLRQGAD